MNKQAQAAIYAEQILRKQLGEYAAMRYTSARGASALYRLARQLAAGNKIIK